MVADRMALLEVKFWEDLILFFDYKKQSNVFKKNKNIHLLVIIKAGWDTT
jgi:hypothetical protein